jgi:hypothetical protein
VAGQCGDASVKVAAWLVLGRVPGGGVGFWFRAATGAAAISTLILSDGLRSVARRIVLASSPSDPFSRSVQRRLDANLDTDGRIVGQDGEANLRSVLASFRLCRKGLRSATRSLASSPRSRVLWIRWPVRNPRLVGLRHRHRSGPSKSGSHNGNTFDGRISDIGRMTASRHKLSFVRANED